MHLKENIPMIISAQSECAIMRVGHFLNVFKILILLNSLQTYILKYITNTEIILLLLDLKMKSHNLLTAFLIKNMKKIIYII